jgi:hypothetical protein
MFKNIRNYLVDSGKLAVGSVPSYFLECLIYNAPNSSFAKSYENVFCEVVNWLYQAKLEDFLCQNEQIILFGISPEQWSIQQAKILIDKIIYLWNNW